MSSINYYVLPTCLLARARTHVRDLNNGGVVLPQMKLPLSLFRRFSVLSHIH